MDIFRLASDSLGVFNNRNDRSKSSCSCGTEGPFGGEITDSAVLSRKAGTRVPSYEAGPSMPLPYSGTMLPQRSSFGSFVWNHVPPFAGSVFQGHRQASSRSKPEQAPITAPLQLRYPVQRKAVPLARAAGSSPSYRSRSQIVSRSPQSKPDLFSAVSSASPKASSADWDGLWHH